MRFLFRRKKKRLPDPTLKEALDHIERLCLTNNIETKKLAIEFWINHIGTSDSNWYAMVSVHMDCSIATALEASLKP